MRALADHRVRRHLLLVLLSLVLIGIVAAAKGALGYYLIAQQSTRIEIGLALAAVAATIFALCQKRIERGLAARFARTTKQHRDALYELADEIEVLEDSDRLAQRLVARFDELFGTTGAALFLARSGSGYLRAAGDPAATPAALGPDDPLVEGLRHAHTASAPAELGSSLPSPLVWPLRVRGQLIGMLAAGHHDYIESFEAVEVDAVSALAESAAATLALIDPALVEAARRQPGDPVERS